MRVRLADGTEADAVPLTPGTLVMEPPETSDTSVWVIQDDQTKRKLTYQEFIDLFPNGAETKEERDVKRDALIQRVDRDLLALVPDHGHAPDAEPSAPASPSTLAHSKLERLQAAVIRVYAAGGKAEGLPVDLDSLRQRMVDAPRAVIEDKIRHFNNWADMQSNAPAAVEVHVAEEHVAIAPEPPTRPEWTKPNPENLRGAVFIASPELREWSTRHDATGRSHMREWFDEKCRNASGPMFELGVDLENDGLLFDRMSTLLDECKRLDKRAHIWLQGDTEHFQHGQPRADWDRVWRRMDAIVEAIKPHVPTISLGLGFDLWEWVPGARHRDFTEFHRWISAMRGELPNLLIGGRPQAPNSRNNPQEPWSTIDAWNQPCSYYSVEYGKPKPHELDKLVEQAAFQNKPAFSENRDRMHNEPYYTYTVEELAQTIREYRSRGIACIVANWEFKRERGRRTGPLPHTIYEAIDEPVRASHGSTDAAV